MTAEIAVMNKDAVALAADSTVTVSGKKTYHTTNKLFALSRYQPVGVMIYGSGELAGIPWETLIKVYRQRLGHTNFGGLFEYKEDFIKFLETDISEYNPRDQREIFLEYAEDYIDVLLDRVDTAVEKTIDKVGSISDRKIAGLLGGAIEDHRSKWASEKTLNFATKACLAKLKKQYRKDVYELIDKKLEKHETSRAQKSKIIDTIACIFSAKCQEVTGVVFAGFGNDDLFPRLTVCNIECVVNQRLKYTDKTVSITNIDNTAAIVPFAQTDIVATFMGGISEKVHRNILSGMGQSRDEYANRISEKFVSAGVSKKMVAAIIEDVRPTKNNIRDDYKEFVNRLQWEFHINPVLDAVQFLPKNEMAEVAESLVSITSFRQKITLEQESVGGAIDVAVISKSDGFVWIKRKHYFEADLNPMFFSKYVNGRSVSEG